MEKYRIHGSNCGAVSYCLRGRRLVSWRKTFSPHLQLDQTWWPVIPVSAWVPLPPSSIGCSQQDNSNLSLLFYLVHTLVLTWSWDDSRFGKSAAVPPRPSRISAACQTLLFAETQSRRNNCRKKLEVPLPSALFSSFCFQILQKWPIVTSCKDNTKINVVCSKIQQSEPLVQHLNRCSFSWQKFCTACVFYWCWWGEITWKQKLHWRPIVHVLSLPFCKSFGMIHFWTKSFGIFKCQKHWDFPFSC